MTIHSFHSAYEQMADPTPGDHEGSSADDDDQSPTSEAVAESSKRQMTDANDMWHTLRFSPTCAVRCLSRLWKPLAGMRIAQNRLVTLITTIAARFRTSLLETGISISAGECDCIGNGLRDASCSSCCY